MSAGLHTSHGHSQPWLSKKQRGGLIALKALKAHCPLPFSYTSNAISLPLCLLGMLFFVVTYLTHQSSTRYARWLLIPPPEPLFTVSTHWESCFMSAGNSKQAASLSLIGPALYPEAMAGGWGLSPSCALNTNRARCSNQFGSPSLSGPSDGPHGCWGQEHGTNSMSRDARGKLKKAKSRQQSRETTWRSRLF